MTLVIGMVFILMPLKLLQTRQSLMINQIPNAKELELNDNNSHRYIYKQSAKESYTQIFTSPEITLFKKFKKNALNDLEFTDTLCLPDFDEILLKISKTRQAIITL